MTQLPFFMNPIFFNNNNNQFQQMNIGGNVAWMQGYSVNNNNNMQANQFPNFNSNKINCVFKASNGKTFSILFDTGRTVEDLILTFFKRIDQVDLFQKGGVSFIYNTEQIDYHLKTRVENFFKYNTNPIIMVLDVNNLIGA